MRSLFPVTDETADQGPGADRQWTLDELADRYAYPVDRADSATEAKGSASASSSPAPSPAASPTPSPASSSASPSAAPGPAPRPWLRANMVSSLDGAAQHDGRSQPISCAADMRIFGTLRGLADVVLVGAETVRKEGYRPARAREAFADRRRAAGQTPAPAVAVISAGLDLDFSAPLFTSPLTPTLILTGEKAREDRKKEAEQAGARVVVAGEGRGVDPARAVAALAGLGLTRLLTEGGPRILGQFIAAGVLDELCLTLSPMVTSGEAQRIADGPGIAVPKRFSLASLLEEEGFLFTRYRRT
ncbi:pyrimidine reductase family protein [Streptomyces triticagri]|uniref:Pyrimidine reductase family protein n=1 Tax=Streptomyces triticagri TaxID=2293568 RepID=A0A372M0H5_9ACTN|nr:pyrimidine reductase family protein [Streptomyces triticagri]RFU84120.1 pyrimidine reductase family protein [Streptomyces triticagri]